MNYTLYIDESGDFISEKGQWLISGVLFADTYENCERFLKSTMSNAPRELGLESIKQFHLTEFRRHGNEKAVSMAKTVLDKLKSLPFDYHCLATIDYTKVSLSSREKTYRMMLSDLLALCETVVPEDEVIENLDLIVATRTIDGVLATSISNINEEIVKSLPVALEVDLATKGMVDLIGKHIKVKMDYANNSWGLVCADFIANLNYHNRKKHEKKYLSSLSKEGKFSLFESFGGYEERRANIAERDKDYVLALYRWLLIACKKTKENRAKKSIQRLFEKIFNNNRTSEQKASIEALLERLWKNNNHINQYHNLSSMLNLFAIEFNLFLESNQLHKYKNLLFRVKNMILLVENHLGDTKKASLVALEQNSMLTSLASNPENFQMILDFKIHEIELSVNSLKLEEALNQAMKYHSMVQNYKEIWKLLTETEELANFDQSRASIKANMALLRCEVLSNKLYDENAEIKKIEQFKKIEQSLSQITDIGRLNNYKIMFYLKQKQPKLAVEICLSIYSNISSVKLGLFDMLWFLRSINDALLNEDKIKINLLQKLIEFQINSLDTEAKGHPVDLIWREVALYEYLVGNKSKALKAIKKSRNSFDLNDSPISSWLKIVLNIHDDYIRDEVKSIKEYFKCSNPFKLENNTNESILKTVRHVTPY